MIQLHILVRRIVDAATTRYLGYGIARFQADVNEVVDGEWDCHSEESSMRGEVYDEGAFINVVDSLGGELRIPKRQIDAIITRSDKDEFESYMLHADLSAAMAGEQA